MEPAGACDRHWTRTLAAVAVAAVFPRRRFLPGAVALAMVLAR